MNAQIEKEEGSMSNLVRFLLEHNKRQSEHFRQDELPRRHYLANHPTKLIAFKCMDGRIHLPIMTEIPLGIIQPFRNLGGRFDLGWPFFGSLIERTVMSAIDKGRRCIIFVTYHWSRTHREHGCKGFEFDVGKAKAFTGRLVRDMETIFGNHSTVYPILLGIETDEDALVFHGEGGEVLNLSQTGYLDETELQNRLRTLFPDMPAEMLADLMPLLIGNQRHIAKLREKGKAPELLNHGEQILAFGRGFDWLHLPNKAIIVGPYDLYLEQAITKAASILLDNLKSGRIPERDGVVLLVSSVFHSEAGPDKPRAILKSRALADFAYNVIQNNVSELVPYLSRLAGVINPADQRFMII